MTSIPHDILSPRATPIPRLPALLGSLIFFGVVYGAAMGAYPGPQSFAAGARPLQMLFSAIKVPLLLLITFAVALPGFFLLNTLLGVRDDFPCVLRALVSTQASLMIILASLAPLTLLWYAAVPDYDLAITFSAFMFAIASLSAQLTLARHYRPLLHRHPAHRKLLKIWLILYGFIGIQSAWTLRPFIGALDKPTTFFRPAAWGNAYEELTHIVLRALF